MEVKRFKSLARGDSAPIHVDQDLKQMIGDKSSILSNDSSKNNNSSSYSIPEVEEDQVTGSQFSAIVLSSGGINAICGSADKVAVASQQDPLTGSLSNRDQRLGTVISNYITEEHVTDSYHISEDTASVAPTIKTSKKEESKTLKQKQTAAISSVPSNVNTY